MVIHVQYYGNELTIEEYETEYGIRYKAYSYETDTIQFNEEGYVNYRILIDRWRDLIDYEIKKESV